MLRKNRNLINCCAEKLNVTKNWKIKNCCVEKTESCGKLKTECYEKLET